MTELLTRLRCSGCGAEPKPDEALPFRCPNAGKGDDVDHVLRRELVLANAFRGPAWRETFLDAERNPFVRYRRLFHSFSVATARGMNEADYVHLVRSLDGAIAEVAGTGFEETPFSRHDRLNAALGRSSGFILIKDETGNVSGSHKARHLAGIAIWLEVARRTGLLAAESARQRLAIASCGNAALAAAIVAKAVGRELDVFVPPDAHPRVTELLRRLGACLTVCEREAGVPGDPCVHRFHDDLEAGALPFGVQGNENGLTLEGGLALGWEIVSALLRDGATLDRVFIQVGGGALASSCAQALREAAAIGVLEKVPRIHAVQTEGGHPLRRAWERVVRRALSGEVTSVGEPDESLALRLAARDMVDARAEAIRYAATHRSEFMWPWESVPHSAAHGILDDETYDWLALVEAMLETGGYPVVASEPEVLEANDVGKRATGIPVDHTGTAGLAGLLHLVNQGVIGGADSVAVLFTGRER
jgi:threonine synthase